MQLILVLAVLMMLGGNGGARPQLTNSEMFETLKYLAEGNGEMDKILKEAEQVSEILSAFTPLVTVAETNKEQSTGDASSEVQDVGLILKPIANIADDSIYNALSSAVL